MRAADVVQEALEGLGLEWARHGDTFTVTLPGEHKLATECALEVGAHSVAVRAFVARYNAEWLVEKNGYRSPAAMRAAWQEETFRRAA